MRVGFKYMLKTVGFRCKWNVNKTHAGVEWSHTPSSKATDDGEIKKKFQTIQCSECLLP